MTVPYLFGIGLTNQVCSWFPFHNILTPPIDFAQYVVYNKIVAVVFYNSIGGIIINKRITVTAESKSGRNEKFHDNATGRNMNREQFVKSIQNGRYDDYHVRVINGVTTPCSNPDSNKTNNLD